MRRGLLSHLTYANVVSTLALFLVLGGGTALATYVVSSNSQIGPDTIYGHNAPAGANKNVVADSLSGADVLESSLGTVPSAANGARKFDYFCNSKNTAQTPILTLYAMTLKADCRPATAPTTVDLWVSSAVPAGFTYFDLSNVNNNGPAGTEARIQQGIRAGGTKNVLAFGAENGGFVALEGQLIFWATTGRVITVSFHARADDGTGRCQVTGTAVQSPN
jgi:hypothetical protein